MALQDYNYSSDSTTWRSDGLPANGIIPSRVVTGSTNNTTASYIATNSDEVHALVLCFGVAANIRVDLTSALGSFSTGITLAVGEKLNVPVRPGAATSIGYQAASTGTTSVFVQLFSAV